jgi:beta-lactamase class A
LDAEGHVIDETEADQTHPTASIGKVFLLCEVAERITDGRLDPRARLARDPRLSVADSGLWQHLAQDSLPLEDLCFLVAAVSDNWATNVLLDMVGLESVGARAQALGCHYSGLHDRVRDARTDDDPPTLSSGTARELAEVARRIHLAARGGAAEGVGVDAARLVEGWLLTGVDLSMVAAPFRLDPLAHGEGDLCLWNKTGTDSGIRADMGVIWTDADAVAYAAIATWVPGEETVDAPFERMHALGEGLASRLW